MFLPLSPPEARFPVPFGTAFSSNRLLSERFPVERGPFEGESSITFG